MSVNKYPQNQRLLVLPEDAANSRMVAGFLQSLNVNSRAIHLLPNAGGWGKVLDKFEEQYLKQLRKPDFLETRMVLLINLDRQLEPRLKFAQSKIPDDLKQRVFVLGVLSKPEELKAALKRQPFDEIGKTLAQECADHRYELWGHDLLKHNQPELEKMILSVKPWLFKIV